MGRGTVTLLLYQFVTTEYTVHPYILIFFSIVILALGSNTLTSTMSKLSLQFAVISFNFDHSRDCLSTTEVDWLNLFREKKKLKKDNDIT